MDDRVALIMSHFYEIGADCVRLSQPTTDVEMMLTGDTRRVWEYIEGHRGVTVSDVTRAFAERPEGRLDADAVAGIIDNLHALRLVVLEQGGGW
jgi:hypothetical protein